MSWFPGGSGDSPPSTPRRSRVQAVVVLVIVVVLVPTGAALFGVRPAQTLLLGALGAAVCAMIRLRPATDDPVWWPEALILDSDQGARRDVARLAWSVSGDDQQVGRLLRLRLRDVALRRLARRGVDLADPAQRTAAVDLLGPEAYRAIDPDVREVVSLTAFNAAVLAVEALV